MLGENMKGWDETYPKALGNVYCGAYIGDGWLDLVRPVIEVCENLGIEIHQIKEKFGALRIYPDSYPQMVRDAIAIAEIASEVTCESCGGVRVLGRVEGGWITSTCEKCK